MGKASSAKKVARAARAGGSRRPGQRRHLGFPFVLTLVVVVGVSLVLFARDSREANAEPRPQSDGEDFDHWHAPYGLYFCNEFQPALPDNGNDPLGIHSHADGVIHIHPFVDGSAGRNARLGLFFEAIGIEASDSRITFPDGSVWDEAENTCEGVEGDPIIQIARWDDAQDAADGDRPNELFTEDFGDIRFKSDREYFTIAFLPEDSQIPVRPGIIDSINGLTDVVDPSSTTTAPTDPSATSSTDTTAPASGEPSDPATSSTDTTAPPAG
ncbi:MAG: hypothetical protein ACRD0G_07285 [Acidimicrobiales bacterium]